jgi:type II secretory pathway component PulC
VVNDENGKTKGITTDNIENFETAKELGFKNGDVLVSLNNEPVDSKDKAVEVLKKYRNASLFRVGLLRDGQMMYKTFRVK